MGGAQTCWVIHGGKKKESLVKKDRFHLEGQTEAEGERELSGECVLEM